MSDDLFFATPAQATSLGRLGTLLANEITGASGVVTPAAASLLANARSPGWPGATPATSAPRLPLDGSGERALRDLLVHQGWLTSNATVLSGVGDRADDGPTDRATWLAIPTCERLTALARALRTYVENAQRHHRQITVVVADGAVDPARREAATVALTALGRELGVVVDYIGLDERRRAVELVSGADEELRDAIQFALFGVEGCGEPIGTNRNALLLHTAGDQLLSVDDDTVCEPAVAPTTYGDRVAVAGDSDPTQFWFFADRAAVCAAVGPTTVDVVGMHRAILGRSVAAVLADAQRRGTPVDLADACAHALGDLLGGKSGRVCATLNGVYGDSAMHSGAGLATEEGDTRRRLVASEERYRLALRSREVIRQAPCTTVCHGGQFMSTFVGLDNRDILPPFPPQFRSEDTVFGVTLGFVRPDAYVAHLPWCLGHAPESVRTYHPYVSGTVRVADLINALMLAWSSGAAPSSPSERLRSLGAFIRELASQRPASFWDAVRDAVDLVRIGRIERLEAALLRHHYHPHFWAADVRQAIVQTLEALRQRGPIRPADMPDANDQGRVQRFVRGYGCLLESWPALMARIRQLKGHGMSIGGALT